MLCFSIFIYVYVILNCNWAVSLDNVDHRKVLRQEAESTKINSSTSLMSSANKTSRNFSECGVSSITKIIPKRCCYDSIVKGDNYNLGDWPWIAGLLYRNRTPTNDNPNPISGCAGSLISKDWVLTAAHCAIQYNAYLTLQAVRLGDVNLNDSVSNGAAPVDVQIDKIFVHPKFSRYPLTNDIALLHLRQPVTFAENIHPICIINGSEHFKTDMYYENKTTDVVGNGKRLEEGELSTALQNAAIHIVDNETCAKNYKGYRVQIDSRVLCAGGDGADSCQGVSGGPLAIPLKNRWQLIGIVSYSVGCGDPNFPGVYTRVAAFSEWIANVTGIIT